MSIGKRKTFWSLINDKDFGKINIPKIQRDYIQGRDSAQVEYARNKLLTDISESLQKENQKMDLNFIYGKTENDCFIPIDGQQRLTTLFLLHIYAFSKEKKLDYLLHLEKNFIYSTRFTTQRFLEALINHFSSYFEEEQEYTSIQSYIEDSAWFSKVWLNDPSIDSFIIVLDEIHNIFSSIENLSQKLISEDCPITFMALPIEQMGKENDLYIKMNSRGKPLRDFEAFKSEFFNLLDSINTTPWPDMKKKIDNEWINIIWKACDHDEKEVSKQYDNIFLYLIHWIIINRINLKKETFSLEEEKSFQKIINNEGFYNFANYKIFLDNNGNNDIIDDIYKTFYFLEFLYLQNATIMDSILNFFKKVAEKHENRERVLLFAITKYAKSVSNYSEEKFLSWYRIITNLVRNTEIDAESKVISACKDIDCLDSQIWNDVEEYFAFHQNLLKISFFDSLQLKEECYKCQLIKTNSDWKEVFNYVEAHNYFHGRIFFALKLIGADLEDSSTVKIISIETFKQNWQVIEKIFHEKFLKDNDNLFRRALLTFGDYSIRANSNYTFFFEGGNNYFNWQRMLQEEKSFRVFQSFFEEIKNYSESFDKMSLFLKMKIEEFINQPDNQKDEFIYYLVKYPKLFDYMDENRYLKCDTDEYKHRIIMFSKYKKSAEYVEMHTYTLYVHFIDKISINYHYGRGYLEDESSRAYIDKIMDIPCHIEYDKLFIDKNGIPLKTKDGMNVQTIAEAIQYITEFIETNALNNNVNF